MNPSIQELIPEDQKEFKDFIIETWKEWGWYFVAEIDTDLDDPYNFYIKTGGTVYLLKRNNKIIGTIAVINKSKDVAELKRLYIDKNYRGQRFGSKLLEIAIDFSKSKGFKKIELSSEKNLETAHKLYKKRGFTLFKEDKEDYYMELVLQ